MDFLPPMDLAASSALSPWYAGPAAASPASGPDDSLWWPFSGRKAFSDGSGADAHHVGVAGDNAADDGDDVVMGGAADEPLRLQPPRDAAADDADAEFDETAFVASFFQSASPPASAGAPHDVSETQSLLAHLDGMEDARPAVPRLRPPPVLVPASPAPPAARVAPAAPFRFSVVVPQNSHGACVARDAEALVARDSSGASYRVGTLVVRSRSGMRKVHTRRGTEIGAKFPSLAQDDCKISLEYEAAVATDAPGVSLVVSSVTASGGRRKEVNADGGALLVQWKRSQGQRQEDTLAEFVAVLRGGRGPTAWTRPVASLDLIDADGRVLRDWVRRV